MGRRDACARACLVGVRVGVRGMDVGGSARRPVKNVTINQSISKITHLQRGPQEAGDEVRGAEVLEGLLHVGEVGPLGPEGAAGLFLVFVGQGWGGPVWWKGGREGGGLWGVA